MTITTRRLKLRQLTLDDAEFILELLNEPAFIQNIGDRAVRTLVDARQYILNGPLLSYETLGFGLYLVELDLSTAPARDRAQKGVPLGICGLSQRDYLDAVDIGFAFLERFWARRYGYESATAVMEHAKSVLGFKRIAAITAPDNHGSIRLLEKLGFRFEKMIMVPGAERSSFSLKWREGALR